MIVEARGRYAPTPSGLLHLGNVRTALVAWLSVRSQGGSFVWRLEDIDGPRLVAGMAAAAEEDLAWLGLDWDEGPGLASPGGGPFGPYVQSECTAIYEAALELLVAAGRLFPCRHSRADLQRLASAPHGSDVQTPYPATLRPKTLAPDWFPQLRAQARPDAALRFLVHDEEVVFHDRLYGEVRENVATKVGDFVLRRRDGLWAYQLAVVVDDLRMGITEIVRGRDLLDSTARQIQLIQALGGREPSYAHLPLLLNAAGEKLSKRDQALALRHLREAGIPAATIVGYLAYSLGLRPTPQSCTPRDLLPNFTWQKIQPQDWRLPADLPTLLAQSSPAAASNPLRITSSTRGNANESAICPEK